MQCFSIQEPRGGAAQRFAALIVPPGTLLFAKRVMRERARAYVATTPPPRPMDFGNQARENKR